MSHLRPTDERDLAAIVATAIAEDEALELVAGGSKRGLGRPVRLPHILDLSAFAGIRAYEPAELVLTAGAATGLADIEAALQAQGQMLAFEPADWRGLFGSLDRPQTIGGVLACNLAGPRRICQGAARDHFLGFRAVSGRGEPFKAGGKVVKNVTGYDLPKLMAGSYGTLAALTEVTVKVLPRPETVRTLMIGGLDDATARRALGAALNSSHEVSGAAHLPAGAALPGIAGGGARTVLRLEGPGPSVAARAAALAAELASFGAVEMLDEAASLDHWRAIRDVTPFAALAERAIWRVSVPPAAAPDVAARIAGGVDARHFFDWGGGLLWLAVAHAEDGGASVIRGALSCGGHATLVRAPDALRAAVPVFQPQEAVVAALSARVKDGFDPHAVLNRGRMYRAL